MLLPALLLLTSCGGSCRKDHCEARAPLWQEGLARLQEVQAETPWWAQRATSRSAVDPVVGVQVPPLCNSLPESPRVTLGAEGLFVDGAGPLRLDEFDEEIHDGDFDARGDDDAFFWRLSEVIHRFPKHPLPRRVELYIAPDASAERATELLQRLGDGEFEALVVLERQGAATAPPRLVPDRFKERWERMRAPDAGMLRKEPSMLEVLLRRCDLDLTSAHAAGAQRSQKMLEIVDATYRRCGCPCEADELLWVLSLDAPRRSLTGVVMQVVAPDEENPALAVHGDWTGLLGTVLQRYPKLEGCTPVLLPVAAPAGAETP